MLLQQQQHQQQQRPAANAAAAAAASAGAGGGGNGGGGQKPVPIQGLGGLTQGPGVKNQDSVRVSEPDIPGSGPSTSSSSSTTHGMTIPQGEQALILSNMLSDPNTRIKMSALSDRVKGEYY